LENGLVFCEVNSWLTGRRLVSLPFSDHCEPLLERSGNARSYFAGLAQNFDRESWRYVEIRPLWPIEPLNRNLQPSAEYAFHQIDLRQDLDSIFASFHKNSIQRKIRRAEREKLTYQEGNSPDLLNAFFRLLVMTRRRHRVPPPPRVWFQNLSASFGDRMKLRIASQNGRAVAAMLTLRFKDTLIYKYGASDARFNNLGGMHLLYWRAIQDAKSLGLKILDLGRSDASQDGLITFKNRWGAVESKIRYFRFSPHGNTKHIFDSASTSWKMRIAQEIFSYTPPIALSALGRLLYKHVG